MNLQFTGTARICWIVGLLLIIGSALISVVTGGNTGFPLVAVGLILIVVAFILRGRAGNG